MDLKCLSPVAQKLKDLPAEICIAGEDLLDLLVNLVSEARPHLINLAAQESTDYFQNVFNRAVILTAFQG
jgi:hypothetical protein